MPNLETMFAAFRNANNLVSFASDVPKLHYQYDSFNSCDKLNTFIAETPILSDGQRMFYGCSSLDTFIGDLSSLEYGLDMFSGTNLSEESVENIADTIKHVENPGIISIIWIGDATTVTDNTVKSLCRIVDKGWELQTNDSVRDLIIASNPEKYQETNTSVELKPSAQTYGMRGNTEPIMKEIRVVCLKK